MRTTQILTLGAMTTGSLASVVGRDLDYSISSSPDETCQFFKLFYPDMTILTTDSNYTAENEVSWNAGAWLGPACVLVPSSAEEMSIAVWNLAKFQTPFAMRGGGHMPVADAANINSTGILISSTNLQTLELSEDQATLSIGPGKRWGHAYEYLDGTGKMVVGGRYAPVGVPGLLIGGGMSFFSYEYGFASTNGNVQSFECVLANGTIVDATADNEHADLYWALQGGGNSFCLVTKFQLRTFGSPGIMLADSHFGAGDETKEQWMNSIQNYVINGDSDVKAAIIPVARLGVGSIAPIYDSMLMYNGNATAPAIFDDFRGGVLPANNSTDLEPITMGQFAAATFPAFQEGGESYGLQQLFHVVPTVATVEAMNIVHDTFFDGVYSYDLLNVTGFFTGLAWNAITTTFIKASNQGIGCPQGVEEIPLYWVEESLTWGDAADDALINEFLTAVNANITAQLEAINATASYLYLNDADETQSVFAGYPAENVARLKAIRDAYDPDMVFTNLMPGGFKVAHA